MWTASQINSFGLNVDADALRNIRDCSRRSTSTASDEELTERDKFNAKQAYATLIKLGGRPTHPLRSQPIWKTTLINGFLYWRDEELEEDRCEMEDN